MTFLCQTSGPNKNGNLHECDQIWRNFTSIWPFLGFFDEFDKILNLLFKCFSLLS